MTKSLRTAVLLVFLAAAAGAAEVIVLRGGVVVQLQRPPVRRGNNVLLTRTDGTLLSVPASEIDAAATAALRAVPPPPPEPPPARPATLAEAARASYEAPKARVKITDANVSHTERTAQTGGNAEEGPKEAVSGAGRVEVADYTQEKSGEALVVRGTLRNPGATTATGVRMTVTALDSKGLTIASGDAGLSSAVLDPGKTAAFSITIPVGTKPASSLKFTPRWVAPNPPSPAAGAEDAASRAPAGGSAAPPAAAPTAPPAPPPPPPTPYGRGSLYAPPAPNAPSEAPKDGKTGYIPGASSPSNQPKPPR